MKKLIVIIACFLLIACDKPQLSNFTSIDDCEIINKSKEIISTANVGPIDDLYIVAGDFGDSIEIAISGIDLTDYSVVYIVRKMKK